MKTLLSTLFALLFFSATAQAGFIITPSGITQTVAFAGLPGSASLNTMYFVNNTDGKGCNDGGGTTLLCRWDGANWQPVTGTVTVTGAPTDATYITQTANGGLSAEQALSGLTTGIVKVTNGTGVLSTAATADLPQGNLLMNNITTATSSVFMNAGGTVSIKAGTGSPEGVVSSAIGSIWLRTDGGADTTIYRKESGAGDTGWVASNTSANFTSSGQTYNINSAGTVFIKAGTGSPEGAVTGNIGSIFLRTDGGTNTAIYRKESGNATNTGWVAVSQAVVFASNPANCTAGTFPLGIDATGAAENCTALPTTISGSSTITASAATGAVTLSIPSGVTLAGTTTGTFSGNLTGNVTGNASGTAATITGLLTSGNIPKADVLETSSSCADAGANDTYACSLVPAITGYVTGTHYRFKANTANTGAASINFNGQGPITIVKVVGGITTTLDDNDIRQGQWVDVVYDGTNMQMQSTLGNVPAGSGTVTSSGSPSAGNIPKFTSATDIAPAAATDVSALWASGKCGTEFMKGDGSCAAAGGTGTVTQIDTTAPLSGGPITTTGTLTIANAAADGSTKGAASFSSSNFSASSGNISLKAAGVALSNIANASANSKLLGSGAAGSGSSYGELTLGTGLSMTGTTLSTTDVPTTRTVTASSPITIDGSSQTVDLSANRTVACANCGTASGTLTNTAIMTGGGTKAIQTPSTTSTLDSSGNAVFAGSVKGTSFVSTSAATPTCDGTAGCLELGAGTAPSGAPATSTVRLYAPTSVTAYSIIYPGTAGSGYRLLTNSSGTMTESIVSTIAVANGGTGAGTFTTNGVLFGNGTTAIGVTAPGNAGEVLTSNGAGSAPTYQANAGAGRATTALDNLASVAINTALLPTGTGIDLGSTTLPFRNLYLFGSGSSYGTNYFNLTGAAGGTRTVTIPDATFTIAGKDLAQTWTAVQTVTNSDLKLLGSSTGATTFTSANAGASNYVFNIPAATTYVPVMTQQLTFTGPTGAHSYALPDADVSIAQLGAQTFTGAQTFSAAAPQLILGVNTTTLGSIKMFGNTSGDATIQPTAAAGTSTVITLPATSGTVALTNAVKSVQAIVTDFATDVTTGDVFYFRVPVVLNGMNLIAAQANVVTAGTTNDTTVALTKCSAAASGNLCSGTTAAMFTATNYIKINTGENDSATGSSPTIDTDNDGVVTGDVIKITVPAVSTTAPKGLIVNLDFQLP